ncbi:outer membrane beta-barrel protein [Marinobacter sp. CHS3-4]|uniref:outer membrane beta-barrel protein n=1 Tax=Marinobacter sp. CHS3-4 TaxID=3045174 RepID=UPI0024B4E6FE|nr:outer membrane beta-barrel protein [Marinobacter sp. CHS3-4]MDI9244619.1 porin family protein [Marinobacter sp. CHS3-4]
MENSKPFIYAYVFVASIISLEAQANENEGWYGGIGLAHSGYFVDEGGSNTENRDQSRTSPGLYAGYKKQLTRGFFIAGELFYNNTSNDENYNSGDTISVGDQYGLKANVGYEWDWGGSLYGILGLAHYEYDVEIAGDSDNESQFRPIHGAGLGYRITDTLSSHLEFTAAGSEINLNDEEANAGLIVIRLGMSYHF